MLECIYKLSKDKQRKIGNTALVIHITLNVAKHKTQSLFIFR